MQILWGSYPLTSPTYDETSVAASKDHAQVRFSSGVLSMNSSTSNQPAREGPGEPPRTLCSLTVSVHWLLISPLPPPSSLSSFLFGTTLVQLIVAPHLYPVTPSLLVRPFQCSAAPLRFGPLPCLGSSSSHPCRGSPLLCDAALAPSPTTTHSTLHSRQVEPPAAPPSIMNTSCLHTPAFTMQGKCHLLQEGFPSARSMIQRLPSHPYPSYAHLYGSSCHIRLHMFI